MYQFILCHFINNECVIVASFDTVINLHIPVLEWDASGLNLGFDACLYGIEYDPSLAGGIEVGGLGVLLKVKAE